MYVFQIVFGDVPDKLKCCMDSVKKYYPEVDIIKFPIVKEPVIESDILRFEILSKYNNVLYIDWDILLKDKFYLKRRLSTNYLKRTPDYSIIYSPDHCFWRDIDKERRFKKISIRKYGWIRKLLRDKEVLEIKGNYNHLRYSGENIIIK